MIPDKKQQRLQWLAHNLPNWAENADELGLSEAQITALQGLYASADATWTTAQNSRLTARNNTAIANTAYSAMNTLLGGLVKTIRGQAQATGNEEIYGIAGISPPAPPTPQPPPGIPTNVVTGVDNMGRISIRWKSTNSAPSTGALFQIRRKLEGQTKYKIVGTVQGRAFLDDSIPAGTGSVAYIIKGYRGNIAGEPSETVTVNLHSVATGDEDGQLELAA